MNTTENTRKGGTMHEDYDDDYESYLDERYERTHRRRDDDDADIVDRWMGW